MMVYGKTPFQHVSNHIKKLHCIMDPTFEINFPKIENPDLLDTMKVNDVVLCVCSMYVCIHP